MVRGLRSHLSLHLLMFSKHNSINICLLEIESSLGHTYVGEEDKGWQSGKLIGLGLLMFQS